MFLEAIYPQAMIKNCFCNFLDFNPKIILSIMVILFYKFDQNMHHSELFHLLLRILGQPHTNCLTKANSSDFVSLLCLLHPKDSSWGKRCENWPYILLLNGLLFIRYFSCTLSRVLLISKLNISFKSSHKESHLVLKLSPQDNVSASCNQIYPGIAYILHMFCNYKYSNVFMHIFACIAV